MALRKWMYYILESYDEEFPQGSIYITSKPLSALKGETKDLEVFDFAEKKIKKVAKVVGLGYADFKDEEDFESRIHEVIIKKLKEVGIKIEEAWRGCLCIS